MNNFEPSSTNWQLAGKQENNKVPGKWKLLEAALTPEAEETSKIVEITRT